MDTNLFRTLFKSSPVGCVIHKTAAEPEDSTFKTIITEVNTAAGQMLCQPEHEVIGHFFDEIFRDLLSQNPDWSSKVKSLNDHDSLVSSEYNNPTQNARFETQTRRLDSNQFATFFLNISSRKKPVRKTALLPEELKPVFNGVPAIIFLISPDNKVIFANEAFARFSGKNIKEALNKATGGVFGCTNSALDPRGCGFSASCRTCDLLKTIKNTMEKSMPQSIDRFSTVLLEKGMPTPKVFSVYTSPLSQDDQNYALLCMTDITHLIRLDEELKISETKFRTLFETAQDAILVADAETGKIVDVNQRAAELLDYPIEKLIGMHQSELHPPQIKSSAVKSFKSSGEQDNYFLTESQVITRNGSVIPVEISTGKRFKLANKTFVVGHFRNITQRKRSEAELRERIKELRCIAAIRSEMQKDISRDEFCQNILNYIIEAMQFPEATFVELQLFDCFFKKGAQHQPDDIAIDADINLDNNKIGNLKVFYNQNLPFLLPEEHNLLEIVTESISIFCQKRQLKESLEQEKSLLRTLLNSIPDLVFFKDLLGNYLECNSSFEALLDRSREQILGKNDYAIFPAELADSFRADDQKVLASMKAHHLDEYVFYPDGCKVMLNTLKTPFFNSNGEIIGLLGVSRDLTSRKEQEEALKEAKEMADIASRAKSDFLASMSHEIRTPLNGVIGFIELLGNSHLEPFQKQYVENAIVSAHSLLDIINDILDFSKIEAGKLELDEIPTDLIDLIEQTVDIIKHSTAKKDIEFLVNIPASLPRFANIDPVRLKQVLINLLSNAVKFTSKGEIELSLKFTPGSENTGKFYFSVRDTGIGITSSQKEKLFKAFSQADSSTVRKFGGTGLGLVISSLLVEKMGSSIQLESVPEKGSIFSFSINKKFAHGPSELPGIKCEIKNILIVDDNANNRTILQDTLQSWGIKSNAAAYAYAAMEILETSSPFDAIIVDYHMPFIDGLELIRMIRSKQNQCYRLLPIILLHSSSDDSTIHQECQKLKVQAILVKPVKAIELQKAICSINLEKTDKAFKYSPAPPKSPDPLIEKATILIAEDIPLNMILVKAIIAELLPEVVIIEAKNGAQAIELFKKQQPDLILMDVQMPEVDGHMAAREIRKIESSLGSRTPIIALTAGALKSEREECLQCGMNEFLTKPIERKALKKMLEKYLCKTLTELEHDPFISQESSHGIDIPHLMRRIGDDLDLFKELKEATLTYWPIYLEDLSHSIASGEIKLVHRAAHKIKGGALSMCCNNFARMAEEIGLISEWQEEKLAGLLASMQDEFVKIRKELGAFNQEKSDLET